MSLLLDCVKMGMHGKICWRGAVVEKYPARKKNKKKEKSRKSAHKSQMGGLGELEVGGLIGDYPRTPFGKGIY